MAISRIDNFNTDSGYSVDEKKQSDRANKEDSDRFANAMKKKKKKHTPHEGIGGQTRTMGDAILRGLSGEGKAEAVQPKSDAERLQGMVDKVLVSASEADGKEVRIQLKESILPGTEIRMTRDDAGLKLQLLTSQQSSMNFLSDHKDNLQQTLAQRLSTDVQVDLSYQEGGDGRSRERRDMYEEMKENEDR